jgi:hypothetical protein
VAAQIQRHEPEGVGQIGIHLSSPGEGRLRQAMDEKDWPSARVTRFDEVESNASTARDAVVSHVRRSRASLRPSKNLKPESTLLSVAGHMAGSERGKKRRPPISGGL